MKQLSKQNINIMDKRAKNIDQQVTKELLYISNKDSKRILND